MMKNIITAIAVGVFPYVPIVMMMSKAELELAFWGTVGIFVIGLVACILNMVLALKNKESAKKQALLGMVIKLVHIPAYVFFFLIGAGGAMLVQFLAVTIIIFLFDCITIALSGVVELAAVLRARSEGKLKMGEALICAVCSFVFCVDLIVAIGVYVCVRKRTTQDIDCKEI